MIRRVTGSIRIGKAAPDRVPEYGELRVTAGSAAEPVVSPLGGTGEFYFENLPDGRFDAVVEDANGTCAFVLEIPASDEPAVDLGELRCVPAEPSR